MSYTHISVSQLHDLRNQGQAIDLIDVRQPSEFEQVHAEGARLIPLNQLSREAVKAVRTTPDSEPVYVICHSGGRSRTASEKLAAAGVKAVNVEGGTSAWQKAGLPVVRGKVGVMQRIARPVGMAAVVAGLILAWLVHPLFALGSAGVWVAMLATGKCPLGQCMLSR